MKEGNKHDDDKPRYDLISPDALAGLANVLTFGAGKYGSYNWHKGIVYSRVFAAVMRHLWDWWNSAEADEETGLSPLDHAAAGIHFLSHYVKGDYAKFDDRPTSRKREEDKMELHFCTNDYIVGDLCTDSQCHIFHPHQPCKYKRIVNG